jgi:hypothetical protein
MAQETGQLHDVYTEVGTVRDLYFADLVVKNVRLHSVMPALLSSKRFVS